MPNAHQLLEKMEAERTKWAVGTKVYGTINVFNRIFLITGTAIVAAGKELIQNPSKFAFVGEWMPGLAVALTVVAGLDAWIKPRDRWRGFMADRDDLESLIIRTRAIQDDVTQIPAAQGGEAPFVGFESEFRRLRRRHRAKNVY